MNRPELIAAERFGNYLVQGIGGLANMLNDFFAQGGMLRDGDFDVLSEIHARMGEMIREHHQKREQVKQHGPEPE